MKVFQDPMTGAYVRADGQPGYGCRLCGNGYATAATRDDTTAHGCEALDRDVDYLADMHGRLREGYTDETIEALASNLCTVELYCAWEHYDAYGFGGNSEIIGRPVRPNGTTGPLLRLHPDVWDYLTDPDSIADLTALESLLDPTDEFETQDFEEFSMQESANLAYEQRD